MDEQTIQRDADRYISQQAQAADHTRQVSNLQPAEPKLLETAEMLVARLERLALRASILADRIGGTVPQTADRPGSGFSDVAAAFYTMNAWISEIESEIERGLAPFGG